MEIDKHKAIQGLIWSCIERLSVQSIQFIFGIIIARLLIPSDYGIIAMTTIFIAISKIFTDSGFSNALIRKQNRTETDFSTIFYINVGIGIIFYFMLFSVSPFIAQFYKTPEIKNVMRVIGLDVIFNSLVIVQRTKLIIIVDFKSQTKIAFVALFFSSLVGLVMAYMSFGVWALVFQTVLNSGLSMILLWILFRWSPNKPSIKSFKKLFGYSSKLLISALIDSIFGNILLTLIGKKFNAANLGFYTRADQFARFPSSNLVAIFLRVTFPIFSEMQNDHELLKKTFCRYLQMSAFIIFPLMCGLAAIAEPFIIFVLTEKWSQAVLLLRLLCFSFMWYPVLSLNGIILQIYGRSDLFLRRQIISICIYFSLLFIALPFGLIAVCASLIVSSLLELLINSYYTNKLFSVGFFAQIRILFPILISALTMSVAVYLIVNMVEKNIMKIFVGILTGIIYYISISIIRKSKELKILFEIFKMAKQTYVN